MRSGWRDGGKVLAAVEEAPLDLAELACPRRSAPPGPGRRVPTDKVERLVELLVNEVLEPDRSP